MKFWDIITLGNEMKNTLIIFYVLIAFVFGNILASKYWLHRIPSDYKPLLDSYEEVLDKCLENNKGYNKMLTEIVDICSE